MSNYSTLQQNTLLGLSEGAGNLYLNLCDKYQAHRSRKREVAALFEACKYEDRVGALLEKIVGRYSKDITKLEPETISGLETFVSERYLHSFISKERHE